MPISMVPSNGANSYCEPARALSTVVPVAMLNRFTMLGIRAPPAHQVEAATDAQLAPHPFGRIHLHVDTTPVDGLHRAGASVAVLHAIARRERVRVHATRRFRLCFNTGCTANRWARGSSLLTRDTSCPNRSTRRSDRFSARTFEGLMRRPRPPPPAAALPPAPRCMS